MGKSQPMKFNLDVNLTIEMSKSEWKDRLDEVADEEVPEEAALAVLAQEFEGEELHFVPGGITRAWIAGTDTGLASII